MEVIPLLIIFTIFCKSAITTKENLQIGRLILDLTRPIHELIGNKISEEDVRSDIHSTLDLIGANTTTSTVFHSTVGSTFEELESRTREACNIIHKILNISSDSQLLISWTLNETTIDALDLSLPYNKTFDGCKPKLVLHFNDGTECDGHPSRYFRNIIGELLDSTDGLFAGVSYDESLHGCEALDLWKEYSTILVVGLKFGTTRGVTESFGLFQARMKFLSETMEFDNENRQILYYPNPKSVGDDEHRNLLIRYASIWTTSKNTKGSMLLQVSSRKNKVSEMTKFAIIPKFMKSTNNHSRDEDILSSLLWFAASFKHQMIFVNEYVWELWNSLPEENIRPINMRNVVSTIDLALDCTWFRCEELNETSHQPSRLNADKPTTFVFLTVDGGSFSIPPKVAGRVTPISTIGCNFHMNFQNLMESKVEQVVRSCQSINGSVYILTTDVILVSNNERGKYSFYYENKIRNDLHAVNNFRKGILERVPSAEVYFQMITREKRGSNFLPSPQPNSLFCDELEPALNLYFEGVFNWAKLENFPIITQIYNRDEKSYFLEWLPLLRRLTYPYSDWSVDEGKRDQGISSSVSSPAFLMQDYLKSIHNWTPDACIDWKEKRWEIAEGFFRYSKIGTVFHPNSILKNQALTKDDCITMLYFIFYRFGLVEISVSWDFGNILTAISQIMAFEDANSEILMKYAMTEQDHQKDVQELKSFMDQLKNSKLREKGLLKGLHVELVVDSMVKNEKNISGSTNFALVLGMMKYAKRSNLTCGIELPSVKMCNKILQNLTFSAVYSEIIDIVTYLVCKENLSSITLSSKKRDLQNLLDSHLALKRTLYHMIPHLHVHFRVEFDFEIDFENHAEVDKYTSFLALFKTFGTQYDITYIVGAAFDSQSLPKPNGWWGITNYSDLTTPQSYTEKVTILRGQQMWYPPPPPLAQFNISIPVSERQDSTLVIVVSAVGSAVLIFLLILGVCFGMRYRKFRYLSRLLSDSEVQEFLNGRVSINGQRTNKEMELMEGVELEHLKFNQQYRLDLSDIKIDFQDILGSGAFGMVFKGLCKNTPAAIKRPNADCSKNTFKSVLSEVKVLSYIGTHPNIVEFLGAYVEEIHKGVLYISTELCSGGSLEGFLRKKSNVILHATASNRNSKCEREASELYFQELNTFAMEIAQGMEYIESRRVVHGDLATRNVLLDDNLVCKIGDFGLSRKLYEYQKYVKTSQEPLPWKWMAHESLTKMEFTPKSDVWSFGVTLWEIYSLGKIPYAGLNWSVDFAKDLENGLRLTIPDFATENIFTKMLDCWNTNPDERPSFAEFANFYKNLGESAYTVLDTSE